MASRQSCLSKPTSEPLVKATQLVSQRGTLRPSDNRAGVAGIHNGRRKGPRELATPFAALSRIMYEERVSFVMHRPIIH
eukprot:1645909-Prymnesium_polylepis.1